MQITKEPVSYYREGLSHVDLFAMFPNEKISLQWFEGIVWPKGRVCPHCGSKHTIEASHKKMPYWYTSLLILFQRQDQYANLQFRGIDVKMVHRYLPVADLSQVRIQT